MPQCYCESSSDFSPVSPWGLGFENLNRGRSWRGHQLCHLLFCLLCGKPLGMNSQVATLHFTRTQAPPCPHPKDIPHFRVADLLSL